MVQAIRKLLTELLFSEVKYPNTSRSGLGGAGTQTATLVYGGTTGVPGIKLNRKLGWFILD